MLFTYNKDYTKEKFPTFCFCYDNTLFGFKMQGFFVFFQKMNLEKCCFRVLPVSLGFIFLFFTFHNLYYGKQNQLRVLDVRIDFMILAFLLLPFSNNAGKLKKQGTQPGKEVKMKRQ